jgi:replicative DNA helicase
MNPHEKELLAHLISSPSDVVLVSQLVSPDDFGAHQNVFEAILNAYRENKSVALEVRKTGKNLSDFTGHQSFRRVEHIARDLRERANQKRLSLLLAEAAKNVPEDKPENFVGELQVRLLQSISHREVEASDAESLVKDLRRAQEINEERFKSGKGILGLQTGFDKLDAIIDGLRPSHFWVVGGYTNTGKTFAALNIAAQLIKDGKRVVFYSVEMNKIDILSRLLGIMTAQSGLVIVKKFAHDEAKVEEAAQQIIASKLSVYSGKSELSDILLSMEEEHLRNSVDLFIVDFIQLVTVKNTRTEYETITESALKFQRQAKKLDVPLMALSQISNEGAKNTENPVMSFKGSGAIAAAADLAIEIVNGEMDIQQLREKMNNGEVVKMKWQIRKNRHGRIGYIDMEFSGKNGIFKQYTDQKVAAQEKIDKNFNLIK